MIFAPIPNFIFSRDIGITINKHILINKPAKQARARETLLMRYILFNHPLFAAYRSNIIEIPESIQHFLRPGEDSGEKTTLEGGDVMVVSPNHVLIGCSERTSTIGANAAIKLLFENNVVNKVTVIKIPHKRDFMHIDTIFTQVKRNVWVLLGSLSIAERPIKDSDPIAYFADRKEKDKPEIVQFEKGKIDQPKIFATLENLLDDISRNDLKSTEPTRFIYSGNNKFPYDAREQWTDSCNLLALKEGVVLGYDRNDKTMEAFMQAGFSAVKVTDLLLQFENNELQPQDMKDTLILMPSSELSRARGGFHCMSMPIYREALGH
jgi:arginine deiminase